jgi:phosphoenolpyruvate-protein kinase (PTS system EI component)
MSKPTRNKTTRKRKTEPWIVRFRLWKVHPSLVCRIKGELRVDAINAKHAYSRAYTELNKEFPKWNDEEFLMRRANDVTDKWIRLTKGGLSNAESRKTKIVDREIEPHRGNRKRSTVRRTKDSDRNSAD